MKWCAVDAQPDTRGAMRFQEMMLCQLRAYTFICYYDRRQSHEHDGGDTPTIHTHRTLALDETFDAFRRERHLLPMNAHELLRGTYHQHRQPLVRTTEPDEFGQPIPTYRHSRPADFAHGETYLTVLANIFGKWGGWWES